MSFSRNFVCDVFMYSFPVKILFSFFLLCRLLFMEIFEIVHHFAGTDQLTCHLFISGVERLGTGPTSPVFCRTRRR